MLFDHSSNKLYHFFQDNRTTWFFFLLGSIFMAIYVYPLFGSPLYFQIFDNLDSTVVWTKILTESGKVFAENDATIPNMMNGLPRVSYGSEFQFSFWLYYFFSPEIAYRLNELLIHLCAYISTWVLLSTYIIPKKTSYRNLVLLTLSLYYATLPFYPGAGLSSSLLPLYVYIFLTIKEGNDKIWHWILLVFIPFFTSLIFLYIFVLCFTFCYLIYLSFKHIPTIKSLWFAFFILVLLYVTANYRLFAELFIHHSFISHRTEFNVYFNHDIREAYFYARKFFLDGWMEHQRSLIMPILLPFIMTGILLSLYPRKFNKNESILIWAIIFLAYFSDIWKDFLVHFYALPILSTILIYAYITNRQYRTYYILILVQILLSLYNGLCFYEGLAFLKEFIPILKSFNISRAAFIQPFIWTIILWYMFSIYKQKLSLFPLFIVFLVVVQFNYALHTRRFQAHPQTDMMTFSQYYAPQLFKKIKTYIPQPYEKNRLISYAIDPSLSLYNGLYTIDGYSTNYPLSYKYKFIQTQPDCLLPDMIGWKKNGNKKMYNEWGSKLNLLCVDSRPQNYYRFKERNILELPLNASIDGICQLNGKYLLSGIRIQDAEKKHLQFIQHFSASDVPWELFLYRLPCKETILKKDHSNHKKDKK